MRKSSRLWWLHGAILVSAVMGCKGSGSCGCGNGPANAPVGGPTLSAGPTAYSQTPTTTFSGASPMPAGSSFHGAGASSAYTGVPSMSSNMSPSMSASMPPGAGGLR